MFRLSVDIEKLIRIIPPTMKNVTTQLGLQTAARGRWHSSAGYSDDGGVRLCAIPVHMAFDRIDVLATNSGEPMT